MPAKSFIRGLASGFGFMAGMSLLGAVTHQQPAIKEAQAETPEIHKLVEENYALKKRLDELEAKQKLLERPPLTR